MSGRHFLIGAAALVAHPAAAADPPYLGSWRIAEAHPAPRSLGCAGPRYGWRDYPPDSLFQGSLTAPAAQATAIGLRGPAIRTLETGCEGLIDFHFRDADTALFALNNNIYVLRRISR